MLWVWPWLEAVRRFQHIDFHRLMLELRGYSGKQNVQMTETSFSGARTPWKRVANAVETKYTHPILRTLNIRCIRSEYAACRLAMHYAYASQKHPGGLLRMATYANICVTYR